MDVVRSTHEGMLRAFALLIAQGQRKTIKQKHVYRPFGTAVHASRYLRKDEAAAVDIVANKLKALDPRDDANTSTIEELLKELSKLPVNFVPMKYEQRIDRSKTYPYRSKKRGG
jgi:hypothetical protein